MKSEENENMECWVSENGLSDESEERRRWHVAHHGSADPGTFGGANLIRLVTSEPLSFVINASNQKKKRPPTTPERVMVYIERKRTETGRNSPEWKTFSSISVLGFKSLRKSSSNSSDPPFRFHQMQTIPRL